MSTGVSPKHISSINSASLWQAHWRASEYLLTGQPDGQPDNPLRIEAAPGARWESFDPLVSYDPTPPKTRQREGMLHLDLLRLNNELQDASQKAESNPDMADMEAVIAMKRLAKSYGLLGLERRYFDLSRPLLSEGKTYIASESKLWRRKLYVAPEAVLLPGGELVEINPETEGRDLLGGVSDIAKRVGSSEGKRWRSLISATGLPGTVDPDKIASPSELRFHATGEHGPDPLPERSGPVSYPTLKEAFGTVLVADRKKPVGVHVLATREPIWAWNHQLSAFRFVTDTLNSVASEDPPEDEDSPEELAREMLEAELAGVTLGFGGKSKPGLRYLCRDPLQAAYLMVVLDHQVGTGLKPCATEGCTYYAREGEHYSEHCSNECSSRHATREYRRRQQEKGSKS